MSSWVGQLLLENFCFGFCFCFVLFCFLLYNIVLVLPYINMNPPRVYTCSQSWTSLLLPSPYHTSGSSQYTSPKHPVSCIDPRLVIRFLCDIIHVSMPFSQIIPPSLSPTKSRRLFYTSVSLLLSCIQGYRYHLSKFHIYALVYCIRVFLSGLLCIIGSILILPFFSPVVYSSNSENIFIHFMDKHINKMYCVMSTNFILLKKRIQIRIWVRIERTQECSTGN